MYLSEKYNIQWWLPVHVGSTVTRFLLEKVGFIPHRGQHPIDPGIDYDITMMLWCTGGMSLLLHGP